MCNNDMFCFQCQETAKGRGCTKAGVCGKSPEVAGMQDLLIYVTKGLSCVTTRLRKEGKSIDKDINHLITNNLFVTITNANFDKESIVGYIEKTINIKEEMISKLDNKDKLPKAAYLSGDRSMFDLFAKSDAVGVCSTQDEDVRSLREMITYGLKGLAAYIKHSNALMKDNEEIDEFIQSALSKTLDDSLDIEELLKLTLETGEYGVKGMALLDSANCGTYGNPEITEVNIGVGENPGILVSGHDLRDIEMLLKQTEGTGIDIYTHSEMLPAHYYPRLKKYKHLIGNYGNAWWKQREEFEKFNGPILMTTNCIVPPLDSYKERMWTTGTAGYAGCKHIDGEYGSEKDFSKIIEQAKKCKPPVEIEEGSLIGGFAHEQVFALADKIVDAVKSGKIRKFIVMGGCDGRMKSRNYYTEFAKKLPNDVVILTAGCAKYKYNKLNLGSIDGIPRVLDAGQCNDSYSLALIALKLKEIFNLNDINDLPIEFNIAWYEQKAVIVLLALLYLGIKNIHLGPTLPAFLSPNITNILVNKFGIAGISTPEQDIEILLS